MRLKKSIKLLLFFATITLAGSVLARADDDQGGLEITNETIEGSWGFSASGTIVPPAFLNATPAVAVGIFEFDGEGLCVISDTINIGGVSASRTSDSCDYTVNPDGTGTLSAQFPGELAPVPLSFVLVDDASVFRFIRTDLGVASGVAERQSDEDD